MHETVQIERVRAMATRRGWSWLGEPGSGFCGRLGIGEASWFVIGADLGVNSAAAARIARDKAFAHYFLQQAGLPVIPTRVLHTPADAEALPDFPLILKPNAGAGGTGVSLVRHAGDVMAAYASARASSPLVLAQPYLRQREFRVVVFDRQPLVAYEKKPLVIRGDGCRSVRQLLPAPLAADLRLLPELAARGLALESILADQDGFQPLPIANLKAGGTWRPCLAELSAGVLEMCVRAADGLGLILAGLDLFAAAPDAETCVINEVNAAPGLECLRQTPELLDPLFMKIERYFTERGELDYTTG